MKNTKSLFLIALFVMLLFTTAKGQDNLQNIFQPEYNNPAYNAFKDFTSINMISRNQWGSKVIGSPEVYGFNFFTPLQSRLGLGVLAFSEKLGLISRFSLSGDLSHYIQLSDKSYLGFGYGIGIDRDAYDIGSILNENPDLIVSDNDLQNQLNARASIGTFYYQPYFYTGLSLNATLNKEYSGSKVFHGFDWLLGRIFELQENILIKPELSVKYFRARESIYTGSQTDRKWVAPIYNLSVSTFLFERLWFGISHRFKYAESYSFDFYVDKNKSLKMGYTFERGIGTGINQFDSHAFRICWNFRGKQLFHNIKDSDSNESKPVKGFGPEWGKHLYN